MNTGEFHVALDDKGRLLIPSRIRNELRGNSVVVTRAIDRCLWVFAPDEWREFGEDVEQHERAEYVLDRWEEESYG